MKRRNKGIDHVKGYATLMVILAHALNDNYIHPDYALLSCTSRVFNTIFTIFASTAVPLFLICTGYLFYQRERTFREIIRNNILPIWLSYAVWLVLNRPLNSYSILANLPEILKEILLVNPPWPQYLWYIPALFGIYLLSPLTHKFLNSLKKKDFIYLFGITLLLASSDYFVLVSRLFGGTDVALNLGININAITLLLYSMYGYYFKHYLQNQGANLQRNLILLLIVFLLLFIPQFNLLTNQIGHRIYYYPLGILLTLLTFSILYHLKLPEIIEHGLRFLSLNSLTYYFAHRFVLYNLNNRFFFINRPVNVLISFVLGVAIVTAFIYFYKIIQNLFVPWVIDSD